jgi:signal transduction histidine kinase
MRCQFIAPEGIPLCRLTAEARRNLYLTIKEALHNAVKHSGATDVTVTVKFIDQKLEMTVEDNGEGVRLNGTPPSGNGLASMNKRMTDIGGTFSIASELNRGTRIAIAVSIPVQTDP